MQQINQSKSTQSQSEKQFQRLELSEIIADAKRTAREDAITWGKAYQHYYADFKEDARMIIVEKLMNKLSSTDDDLDESIFNELHSPPIFPSQNNGKKQES
ncbi:MAG: hypothetical protein F6K25_29915 [Okeania sp. SIO2G4]|uniref:hypothetical protein n=1 Tax=unclassified Okeania TaxID=2634635 RepID=UPI0013B9F664|nr:MULTISPECIES: hypothetical protein [unclassified Okeania]NEP03579.1 hypothetical protein [Okeania sp. SIO4D6]NEP75802.1 hypothetical protein [Okeania sp. SIO2G5]NEP96987.1 hypothetical protein [Okeania sp. SIO2F5]NEQ94628.1 hypothetical protein [Okeania sp. SIO2G4]